MTVTSILSQKARTVEMPFEGNGFNYEAEFFGELLLEGKKDNEIMPLDESLEIMSLLDRNQKSVGPALPIRRVILIHPSESPGVGTKTRIIACYE